jgi:hypothetical protein
MSKSFVDWTERKTVIATSPLALPDISHSSIADLLYSLVGVFGSNGQAKNHLIETLFTV